MDYRRQQVPETERPPCKILYVTSPPKSLRWGAYTAGTVPFELIPPILRSKDDRQGSVTAAFDGLGDIMNLKVNTCGAHVHVSLKTPSAPQQVQRIAEDVVWFKDAMFNLLPLPRRASK